MRSIGSLVASRRLEELVEFVRQFVRDRPLKLSEAVEVQIEGALCHRRLADHVVEARQTTPTHYGA